MLQLAIVTKNTTWGLLLTSGCKLRSDFYKSSLPLMIFLSKAVSCLLKGVYCLVIDALHPDAFPLQTNHPTITSPFLCNPLFLPLLFISLYPPTSTSELLDSALDWLRVSFPCGWRTSKHWYWRCLVKPWVMLNLLLLCSHSPACRNLGWRGTEKCIKCMRTFWKNNISSSV